MARLFSCEPRVFVDIPDVHRSAHDPEGVEILQPRDRISSEQGSDTFQVSAGTQVVPVTIGLPLYISFGEPLTAAGWSSGAWTVPVMIVLSVVGAFLYFGINRMAGAVFVSQANYVTVVAGMICGWVIFNESVTWGFAFSFSFVLPIASLWLTRRSESPAEVSSEQ